MKNAILSLQVLLMFAFLSSFVASFYAIDSIKENSREMIVQKVSSELLSTVIAAEELFHSSKIKTLFAEHHIEVITGEINHFKDSPTDYVAQLVKTEIDIDPVPLELRTQNKLKNALLTKVFSWKLKLKNHFQATFESLVFDVRLFLLSNLLGLLAAALINWRRENLGKQAFTVSLALTLSIFISSYSYINSNWLFNILLNSYMGIAYPVVVVVTAFWLFHEYKKTMLKG